MTLMIFDFEKKVKLFLVLTQSCSITRFSLILYRLPILSSVIESKNDGREDGVSFKCLSHLSSMIEVDRFDIFQNPLK